MGILEHGYKVLQNNSDQDIERKIKEKSAIINLIRTTFNKKSDIGDIKMELLNFLNELKILEAKFWGIYIINLETEEEKVVEDTNHLIHIISREREDELKLRFLEKDKKNFLKEIYELKSDFLYFKRKIKKRDKLKNLISKFTIKLVDHNHYLRLEQIFILEKQLYEVIENQEEEFDVLFKEYSKLKFTENEDKTDFFLNSLKKIRKILSGHLEHHKLWEEERESYSNTSNILNALIKIVKNTL